MLFSLKKNLKIGRKKISVIYMTTHLWATPYHSSYAVCLQSKAWYPLRIHGIKKKRIKNRS